MRLLKSLDRPMFFLTLALFIVAGFILSLQGGSGAVFNAQSENWDKIVEDIFRLRSDCLLSRDEKRLESVFLTDEKNGRWAYELELQRAAYLSDWAARQGAVFTGVTSRVAVRSVKQVGRGYSFYVLVSCAYAYAYENDPEAQNIFRLGGYHSLDLIPGAGTGGWVISREWYDDPLMDTLKTTSVTDDMTAYIAAHPPIDISGLSERRAAAVEYAEKYCGAASDGWNNYAYNCEYANYNALGGDCANFTSQALLAGGFKKNATWNFAGGKGSRAWVNAQALKNYLLYSARASLLASGSYKDIYQYAYSLRPGDIVAYVKKGKVTHVALVTGVDSKGYPLITCHNLDRYRVPWDMGWSGNGVKFILLNVSY